MFFAWECSGEIISASGGDNMLATFWSSSVGFEDSVIERFWFQACFFSFHIRPWQLMSWLGILSYEPRHNLQKLLPSSILFTKAFFCWESSYLPGPGDATGNQTFMILPESVHAIQTLNCHLHFNTEYRLSPSKVPFFKPTVHIHLPFVFSGLKLVDEDIFWIEDMSLGIGC